ncbi:MAG TPA: hypothetical protein IAB31_13045 [Candidatus Choladousia intestinavium]|uniref:Uncharacterized protein n=1 Tax=Candidatus Choladousia intestinavium TaxID=2840727 RepID=A0A9D1DA97_9FIRM|nr:hypothetical protein [Candidatus Choladousia intestinavium]
MVSIITAVSEVFGMLPEPVRNFVIILGALLAAFTALAPVIAALTVSFGALNISLLPVIGIIAGGAVAIVGIIAIAKTGEWFSLRRPSRRRSRLSSAFLTSRTGGAACGPRHSHFSRIPGTQSCRIPLSSGW